MEALLRALPALVELGVPAVALIAMIFLVVFFVRHLEKKDEQARGLIDDFRGDIKEMSSKRSEDSDKQARALDELRAVIRDRKL